MKTHHLINWIALIFCLFCVSISYGKVCHLNNVTINQTGFPAYSCWICYEKSFESLKKKISATILKKENCLFDSSYVPGLIIDNKCELFVHRSKSIKGEVHRSLSNTIAFNQWMDCCEEAESCCDDIAKEEGVETFETCEGYWDERQATCFYSTAPDELVHHPCPRLHSLLDISSCPHFTTSKCLQNSNWSSPDFSQCFPATRLTSDSIIFISILSSSVLVCLTSIFIFTFDSEVRTKHFKLFALLISIILIRHSVIITSKCLIYMRPELPNMNEWWCRLMSASCQFLETFEYFTLFYLVTSFKCHFRDAKLNKNLFFIGIIIAIITTACWCLLMLFTLDILCWQIQFERPQHWMNDGVRISFFLTANYYLLAVLCDRNRERTIYEANDTAMKFSASKFLLIVFAVFWIEIFLKIFLSFQPPCGWEKSSLILVLVVDALKGILLSILIILHSKIWKCCTSLPKINFFTKQAATDSNVNLSLPRNFSAKGISQQDSVDWDNFLIHAKKSINEQNENFYSAEPRTNNVSSLPDPTKSRLSIISDSSYDSLTNAHQQRDTIRNIMYRAKHNLSRGESLVTQPAILPLKVVVAPPVPKNIPNQILDDVQLFDFYYKNLDSITSNPNSSSACSSSTDVQNNNPPDESSNVDNRTSFHRLSRILTFNSKPATNSKSNPRLCRMTAFDESTSGENAIAISEIK